MSDGKTIALNGLEEYSDNDKAEQLLNLSYGSLIKSSDLVLKSMYDFDLTDEEGIVRFLTLLNVMDPDIIAEVMGEIWPGYESESDPRKAKNQIRGYFKDWLTTSPTNDKVVDESEFSL